MCVRVHAYVCARAYVCVYVLSASECDQVSELYAASIHKKIIRVCIKDEQQSLTVVVCRKDGWMDGTGSM